MNKFRLTRCLSLCLLGTSIVLGSAGTVLAQQAATTVTAPGSRSDQIEEITVTGIRASVQKAQQIKRDAAVNVESVTTEDLGKFADASVADAVKRIPGVQIQRNDDAQSGDRASIRGLGSQYITTTVNGREAMSYGDYGGNLRSFNLDSVPSEVLTGVTVYKTSSSELVESGLAGAIDMQTLRPLDYKPRTASATNFMGIAVRGDYDDLRKKTSPRVSGFIGSKNSSNTLGAYLAFTVATTKRRQDENEAWNVTRDVRLVDTVGGPVTTIPKAAVADEWNLRVEEFDRKRSTFTSGIQFRPTDEWDLNADFTYNRYDIEGSSYTTRIIPGEAGVYNGIFQPGGITFDSHGNQTGLDTSKVVYDNPNPSIYDLASPNILLGQEAQANKSKSYSGGMNAAWQQGDWKIVGDLSGSSVKATSVFNEFYTYSPPINFQFNGSGSATPKYTIPPSFLDQSQYRCIYSAHFGDTTPGNPGASPACYFLNNIQFFGDRSAARIDFTRTAGNLKFKFGGRYQITHTDNRFAQDFSEVPGSEFAALRAAYFTGRSRDTFPGLGIGAVPLVDTIAACHASAGLAAICNKSAINVGSFAGAFPSGTTNAADVVNAISFGGFHNNSETNLGLYFQVDAKGQLFGIPYDANAGIRGIKITERAQGFSGETQIDNPANGSIKNFAFVPVLKTNSYSKYLPSLNLNLHPRNNMNVRFAAAEVMTLPQFEDMSASGNVTYAINAQGQPGTFSGGNVKLKPITSLNYDLTVEFYTDYGGAYIASLFYKDAKDFILTDAQNSVPIAGFTPAFPTSTTLYNVSQPANFSDGHADGFEVGTNQPFRFLPSPWDGLGFQANYTYVYSKFDKPDPRATYGFPGTSKNNINAIVYYEKYGFGARLAYNHRSDYFNAFGDGNGYRTAYPAFTQGSDEVDASVNYQVNPHLEIAFSGENLTQKGRYDYNLYPSFFRAAWTRPRIYSLGFRATL